MGPLQPALPGTGFTLPAPPVPPAGTPPAGTPPPGTPPGTAPDTRKQAFDFAADATKQLITVATGVVTATAVFSKDLDSAARYWALASWIVLTISVLFGLAALLNMTGNLHNAIVKSVAPTLSEGIQFFSKLQLGSFFLGIIMVIVFGFFAAAVKSPPDNKAMTINCVVPNPPAPVIIQVPTTSSQSQSTAKKGSSKKVSRKKQ
jgi:hypothetical protein